MSRRIAVCSQKGGVGKTTVALHLGLALAEAGRRVLVVDLDPQGGIAHVLARGDGELPGLTDVLAHRARAAEVVRTTRQPRLDLLVRGRLEPAEAPALEVALYQRGVLAAVLDALDRRHDLVILDTPSGMGLGTRAALQTADHALVLMQAEPLAFRTVAQALEVIAHVRAHENPRLSLLGILPTLVDTHDAASLDVVVAAWTELAGVLETMIPRAAVFAIASAAGVPVGYLGGPPSPEARRFALLAAELETLMPTVRGEEAAHGDPRRSLL